MKRNQFITGIAATLALPSLLHAQTSAPARLPKLGILSFTPDLSPDQLAVHPNTRVLADMGWIDGKTITIEQRSHAGRDERLPELAAELVAKGVDVIWALGPPAAVAAARATKSIPIVFGLVIGPIGLGLAQSLARPGGNVTGVATVASNQAYAKPYELLREIQPEVRRVAAIVEDVAAVMNVAGEMLKPPAQAVADAQAHVARHTGIEFWRHPVTKAGDLDAVFAAVVETRPEALYVGASPTIYENRRRIADFALRQRLASVSTESPFADAGGLLSYGFDVRASIRQGLGQLDRVLRGARPADMPIEQPTRFELVINLKTARALGIKIPSTVLLRADRVIE